MKKLKRTEVRAYTMALLEEQGGECALCQKPINTKKKGTTDYVLDHAHFGPHAGQVRGVLHRHCNRAEAKIAQAAQSWGTVGKDYEGIIEYLENLVEYYRQPPQEVIYHLHKTPEEQRELRNLRARKAYAKRRAKETLERRNK